MVTELVSSTSAADHRVNHVPYDWTGNYEQSIIKGVFEETSWNMWMPQFYPQLCKDIEEKGVPYGIMLDIGSGNGAKLARYFKDGVAGIILAIDLSLVALKQFTERIRGLESISRCRVIGGDAVNLPIAGACVDAITMSCVASHLQDGQIFQAAKEQNRVLRPGGKIYVTEFGPSEYWHGQRVPEDGRFVYHWDKRTPPRFKKYEGMYNRLFEIEDLIKIYGQAGLKLETGIVLAHPNAVTNPEEYNGRTLCNAIFRKPTTQLIIDFDAPPVPEI